jgi:beta-glucanase (GH16 family)
MKISGRFSCALVATLTALIATLAADGRAGSSTTKTATTIATTAPAAAVKGCGKRQYRKPGSGYWTCSFADNFNGTTLNTRKWSRITTAESGFHNGPECYLSSGSAVRVKNGMLRLRVARTSTKFLCESAGADYMTQYTGGSVTTMHKFRQTYGRFEIRARFPAAKVQGLHSAIWLWPQTLTYGRWPQSGEIDVAEFYTRYPDRAIPFLHYHGDRRDPDRTNNYCYVRRPQAFHTYRLTWTARAITIRYDGKVCLHNDSWSPLELRRPAPFDHPFVVNLTQALGIYGNAFQPSKTPLPATMRVDYVRVWR